MRALVCFTALYSKQENHSLCIILLYFLNGAKKPDKATWGDVQYVFAMYYSDGFPKVFKCENELVKATLMYLDDPDAPEGVAFIRWLAVQDYLGEKINWKDLT